MVCGFVRGVRRFLWRNGGEGKVGLVRLGMKFPSDGDVGNLVPRVTGMLKTRVPSI